jgi:hypothetical protein
VAIGHKPSSIPFVGRIDGASRYNGNPAGVTDAFQVRMHSVEPILSNRSRNLFSHDDSGASGANERGEGRPEVPFVRLPGLLSGNGKRLAGAAPGPKLSVVCPASQSSSEGPSSDPCKEMALRVALEVIGTDIDNAPFINIAGCDQVLLNQVAEPLRGVWVNFIIISRHFRRYSAALSNKSGASLNLPKPWLHWSQRSPRTHFPHVLSPLQHE